MYASERVSRAIAVGASLRRVRVRRRGVVSRSQMPAKLRIPLRTALHADARTTYACDD